MKSRLVRIAAVVLFAALAAPAGADEMRPLDPDAGHVERWNWFVDAVYALHKQRIRGRKIRTTAEIGGYFRQPEFYKEVKYFDADSGEHISTIQWEREHPDRIHAIEVFVYDKKGRVMRDYSALFLTHSRNAPQQTLINLHAYNQGLHAFRQFDATDNRIYEFCEGLYRGKAVEIRYDEVQIIEYEDDPKSPMSRPEYKACFAGLPVKSAGVYLTPQ